MDPVVLQAAACEGDLDITLIPAGFREAEPP
jgi:hypothetical protein